MVVVLVCGVAAAVSLLAPATLGFDPWAWLVWGRELAQWELDTTGGPSWKPLPVLVDAALSPFGEGAVHLWTFTVRLAALLGLVGVHRLAARLGPGRPVVAGSVAVGLLVLTPDPDPRFLRLVAEGHAIVVATAALVWAAVAVVDRRPALAGTLVVVAGLVRPEAWPLVGVLALWVWWTRPDRRRAAVLGAAAALVGWTVAWLGLDWIGSGDALHGATVAQVELRVSPWARTTDAAAVVAAMVVAPAWVLAAVAVVRGRRHAAGALGGLALLWCALVVGMAAVFGYAALSRFVLPAAALVAALAGAAVAGVSELRRPVVLTVAGVLVAAPFLVPRVAGLGDEVDDIRFRARLVDDLDDVLAAIGGEPVALACGEVAIPATFVRPAVAWKLGVPLHRAGTWLRDGAGVAFVRTGGTSAGRLSVQPSAVLLHRSPWWSAIAVDCPPAVQMVAIRDT